MTFANPQYYKIAKDSLLTLRPLLDAIGFEWVLSYGTLLGCCREHDLIPHDSDVDIAIDESASNEALGKTLKEAGFYILDIKDRGVSVAGLGQGTRRDVSIDIWKHFSYGKNRVYQPYMKGPWVWEYNGNIRTGGHGTYDKIISPRQTKIIRVPFLGDSFPIPENYDEILTAVYGNWHHVVKDYKTTDTPNSQWGRWGETVCE